MAEQKGKGTIRICLRFGVVCLIMKLDLPHVTDLTQKSGDEKERRTGSSTPERYPTNSKTWLGVSRRDPRLQLAKYREYLISKTQASGDSIQWTGNPRTTPTSSTNVASAKARQRAPGHEKCSMSLKRRDWSHVKPSKKRARSELGDIRDLKGETLSPFVERCEFPKILFRNNSELKLYDTESRTHGHYLASSVDDTSLPTVSSHDIKLATNENGSITVLGKGVYGFVIRGQLKEGNKLHDIVAKFFRADKNSLEAVLNEARILHFLGATGAVPRVYGILQSDQLSPRPILIQECFANGQDLYKFLESAPPKSAWITACIAATEGLLKIHAKGVLLNDIKPDNILIDEASNVRYIDMGMATLNESFLYPTGPLLEKCHHLAPEIVRGEPTTKMSDIFSLGIVLQMIGENGDVPDLLSISQLMTCPDPFLRCSLSNVITLLQSLDCDDTLLQ
ncbi:uncharacterized protein LOC135467006 [Liolophura sinensis]|uniref:uncharacterized protein LOC135467006 n=1 Tax=Liolophura sinensis TaxID=3198878 RepID=UPI0031582290